MPSLLMLAPFLLVVELAASPLTLLPSSTFLVFGEVIGAIEGPRIVTNTIRIDHVYHGPSELVARTFVAQSADGLTGNATNVVEPRLRIGENAIWLVQKSEEVLRPNDWYNYMRWPARETRTPAWAPAYGTIKTFAEAVERVSRLDDQGEAVAALERLATDANPYISSWAIARLPVVSAGVPNVPKFLIRLATDERVPIQGQVALDRALQGEADLDGLLIERQNDGWQRSPTRMGLFRRWVSKGLPKREASLVVGRLSIMAQHPSRIGVPQSDLMKVVALIAQNDDFPLSERQRVGAILGWAAERYDEGDEKVFETAVELVSSDLRDDVRMRIAGVFVSRVALDETRRGVLTKLRDAEKTQSVAEVLERALARPNGEPERPFVYRRGSQRSD